MTVLKQILMVRWERCSSPAAPKVSPMFHRAGTSGRPDAANTHANAPAIDVSGEWGWSRKLSLIFQTIRTWTAERP